MAIASRPDVGATEIEAGDDFLLNGQTTISGASFVGLLVPGTGGTPSVSDVLVEMYRVFPKDSNTVRTPDVPTPTNSPSDVAFDTRDSAGGSLTFSTSVLAATFTALNSVQPGGIHPSPLQTTGGNGPLAGQEVQFNLTFSTPFSLPADHYFFVPQVSLTPAVHSSYLPRLRPPPVPPATTP